jgi:hypothetical protein
VNVFICYLDKLTHLIGCGGFGKVFAAKGEDIEYALKVFGADEANRDDALHEVTVLNHLPRNRLLLEVCNYD